MPAGTGPSEVAHARQGGPAPRAWPTPLRQVRDAFRGHPLRQDILLACAVAATIGNPAQGPTASSRVPLAFIVGTAALQSLLLVWRRRHPEAVFACVLAACAAQWATGTVVRTDISLMVCLYTLARYQDLRRLKWAAAATLPVLMVAALRIPQLAGERVGGLFFLCTAAAASIALGLVARDRHAQMAALADRAERLEREREQRVQLATLAERGRVSREMHDIVGHSLAVIVGLADGGASQVAAHPERGRQALDMIAETARQALSDLRRTLGALREPRADDSLAPQPDVSGLHQLLDRTRAAGPRVSYQTSGDPGTLPRGLQLAVYRIVQESLTNSLKHAGPHTTVHVRVEISALGVRVIVADTGNPDGPAAVASPDSPGQGLTGIRERAVLADGTATAGPNADGGWTVAAVLPLGPNQEQHG